MAASIICSCSNNATVNNAETLVARQGTQFIKNGKPYHYIGTNMWYASVLGSEGEGGNRERLCRELDHLKSIGVTNLRILTGPDAGSALANPAKPYLQTAPGVLNDTILQGLDFVIAELEKREQELEELRKKLAELEAELLDAADDVDAVYIRDVLPDKMRYNLDELKSFTAQTVKEICPEYSIHDFRTVIGQTHTNLIFDLISPHKFHMSNSEIIQTIEDKLSKIDERYFVVITIEHAFN